MNYYIQGDPNRAKEIETTFEKLGYSTSLHVFFDTNTLYATIDGSICECSANGSIARIIKTHPDYKELELPVEPKFKIGDWIVRGKGFVYEPSLITEIRNFYICELQNGERVTYTLNDVHKNFHPWSIQDAKDGDVLASIGKRMCPFIYRKTSYNNQLAYYYAGIDGNGDFCEGCLKMTLYHFGSVTNVVPATKEQRDLLFAKMREAGCEWDADKKELKKIQPHYDISNFHAGMPVLVRETSLNAWQYVLFSHCYTGGDGLTRFNAGLVGFTQCIPFDGNKHLLGTTEMPSEEYINW